jgi:hypothetical protein
MVFITSGSTNLGAIDLQLNSHHIQAMESFFEGIESLRGAQAAE